MIIRENGEKRKHGICIDLEAYPKQKVGTLYQRETTTTKKIYVAVSVATSLAG